MKKGKYLDNPFRVNQVGLLCGICKRFAIGRIKNTYCLCKGYDE